jgi:hypothetical protein
MLCRTFCTMILTFPLIGFVNGCDNRPKFIMPTEKAPPAPHPHVAGGGSPPAEPHAPNADPKKPPADSTPPEDKK